jgi:hypothetical protein
MAAHFPVGRAELALPLDACPIFDSPGQMQDPDATGTASRSATNAIVQCAVPVLPPQHPEADLPELTLLPLTPLTRH